MMDKKDFTAILQVALWHYEGISELGIKNLLAELCSDEIIEAGIGLANYLNSITIKNEI
jgi:hypothetical protein